MKTDPSLERKVAAAMDSLEGIQRAEPAPFLFTRIQSRLERDDKTLLGRIGLFVSRPVVAIAVFASVLAINISFFVARDKAPAVNVVSSGSSLNDPQANDFLLAGNSTYDYSNPE